MHLNIFVTFVVGKGRDMYVPLLCLVNCYGQHQKS